MDPALLIRRGAVLLLALGACINRSDGPGRFGELRVQPGYLAGQEPAALGVSIDSAQVVVTRPGNSTPIVNQRLPYQGGPLAWVVDLDADEETLAVTVELRGGGAPLYSGDTTLTARHGDLSGRLNEVAVEYIGPSPVETVIVSPGTATLAATGATQAFTAEAFGSTGAALSMAAFTWSSSDEAVATVDPVTGVATATGHGRTTIVATTAGRTGSATLDVDLAASVVSVVVTPASVLLDSLGATRQFTAQAVDQHGAPVPGMVFAWSSSTDAVASVDPATGVATATGHGEATLTARAGDATGTATVEVNLVTSVVTVTVTPAEVTLTGVGATQQFTAEARDAAGTVLPGMTFAWSSDRPEVATVESAGGLATVTGPGVARITAEAGGASGSATLTANPGGGGAVRTVVVTPATATLAAVGVSQQYTAEARDEQGRVIADAVFTWTSSDAAVAMIGAGTGLATATGHGTATITAVAGGVAGSASLTVNLGSSVHTVRVLPATATLALRGATQQFTAEARDAGGFVVPGMTFAWSSSNPGIATVDAAGGLATATGHGTAQIFASAAGASGFGLLSVDLIGTVTTVTVTPAAATLTATGATRQFSAVARDAAGNPVPGIPFVWHSSHPSVATVASGTGLATATGHGNTTITAASGAVTGSATLAVNLGASIASVTITPSVAQLSAPGATQQFTAVARDTHGAVVPGVPFQWQVLDPSVATIGSATGLATATGHGTTLVLVTTGTVADTAALQVNYLPIVDQVVVTPATATLSALGAVQQLTAQALDQHGAVLPGVPFTWASSADTVAVVGAATGLVSAAGHGLATITATAGAASGTATITVDLAATVATIVVSPSHAVLLGSGASQQFSAVAYDHLGAVVPGIAFTWLSADLAIVTIDSATGLARPAGNGVTTVSASAGGVSGTAGVRVGELVTPAPAGGKR